HADALFAGGAEAQLLRTQLDLPAQTHAPLGGGTLQRLLPVVIQIAVQLLRQARPAQLGRQFVGLDPVLPARFASSSYCVSCWATLARKPTTSRLTSTFRPSPLDSGTSVTTSRSFLRTSSSSPTARPVKVGESKAPMSILRSVTK